MTKRSKFDSFVHFYRHAQTWAFFHVAVGAISVSDAIWWLTDITELADARGEHCVCVHQELGASPGVWGDTSGCRV